MSDPVRTKKSAPLKDFWFLTKPYWTKGEDRKGSIAMLIVSLTLTVITVYLYVKFNDWSRSFYESLQKMDASVFPHLLLQFCLIVGALIAAVVYQFYLTQLVQIRWRRWMNESILQDWLSKQAYYLLPLTGQGQDNPDQRIAEDISLFTSETLSLLTDIVQNILTIISFGVILCQLSGTIHPSFFGHELKVPGYLLLVAIAYALIGTAISHWIGKRLIPLNVKQQRYEADYRFSLARIRENSESIALGRGEGAEQKDLQHKFKSIYENFIQIANKQKGLIFYSNLHNNCTQMIALFVAAPRYFAKLIDLGDLMQINGAFSQVQGALSFFIGSYATIARWRSVCIRLKDFSDSIETAQAFRSQIEPVSAVSENTLRFANFSLALPDGRKILDGFNYEVKAGDRLLITGKSGCGKSTLLRAAADIWPFQHGEISRPSDADSLFLPQRPYLPNDRLRVALTYPRAPEDFTDEAIIEVMKAVDLSGLEFRLDEFAAWSQILSPGEQQRVTFARALLLKPKWLFMDESTSALDEATQTQLYSEITERLKTTTWVTVAHRESLQKFHNRQLSLGES